MGCATLRPLCRRKRFCILKGRPGASPCRGPSTMSRFSALPSRLAWAVPCLAILSCGGEQGNAPANGSENTVLTLEIPAPEVNEAWRFVEPFRFEYGIGLVDPQGTTEPRRGDFERVGQGAANYVARGEPTEILRARADLPAGRYGLQIRLRDADDEVLWTFSDWLRVEPGDQTEWYALFDPRTADPLPIPRLMVLTLDLFGARSNEAERIEYGIRCGNFDDDSFLSSTQWKRSIACGSESLGLFEATPGPAGSPSTLRWQATHPAVCGPCRVALTARNTQGEVVCTAEVEFDVEAGVISEEAPSQYAYVALPCVEAGP